MARISCEFEIAAYDDGSGTISASLNCEDISKEPYVALKQGDQLITLSVEAIATLTRAMMRLQNR